MTKNYRRKKDGAMFRNTKILEPRKSYLAEVKTYGEDRDGRDYHERNVFLHMKNSDLERWCQKEGIMTNSMIIFIRSLITILQMER